ncbi:C2 domain containing protein [Nitzschia inconspicua]|uniref:C2 domain containing protein n=2 Tax=Nitzschia inconspicua TaxID=303405 RepID=A0A9K3KWX9_9STRA|nr:C2 domain containing protein [Nitzschia inconspicua]
MFHHSKLSGKNAGGSSSPDRVSPSSGGIAKQHQPGINKEKEKHVLESLRYWDVVMSPVRKYMVGGYLVPGFKNALSEMSLGALNKKRRITLELYKKIDLKRIDHQNKRIHKELLQGFPSSDAGIGHSNVLDEDDVLIFRIMKPVSAGAQDRDNDDESVGTIQGDLEAHYLTTFSVDNYGDGYDEANTRVRWKERYRTKLQTMDITNVRGRNVDIQMGVGEDTVVRNFSFHSIQQADAFVKVFNELGKLQRERGLRQAAAHGSDVPAVSSPIEAGGVRSRELDLLSEEDVVTTTELKELKDGSNNGSINDKQWACCVPCRKKTKMFPNQLNLLVEICSAWNLPIGDVFSSDPYVLVRDGKVEWHRTGFLPTTLNPVWTLSTGSLFLIQVSLAEFFENSNYMEFIVKDYDSIGDHEILGSVLVSKTDMLNGTGDRVEYELNQYSGKNHILSSGAKKPSLALRFKLASEDDIKFMMTYEANKKKGFFKQVRGAASRIAGAYAGSDAASRIAGQEVGAGLYASDSYLPLRVSPNPTIQRNKRPTEDGKAVQYRVKPFPDPDRPIEETKWLTHDEIEEEAFRPSTKWIEAGTGSLGKYYVEVIGCDDLPDMDFSLTGRDKTDAFCTLVYEDCVVNTDVIHDCLSPRWPCWSQRAFVFNIMHSSSQIHIGLFDYDEFVPGVTKGPSGKHDKIGRVVVNPTNFRPNIVHTLRYHIFTSDEPDRELRGTLILRCRYESQSERQILFSQLQLQTQYSVSTVGLSDFRCTYYAVANDRHHQTLSLSTLTKYGQELQDYTEYLDEIADALLAVFLWRETFPLVIPFFSKRWTIMIPLHSIIAFTWGIILVRDFEKIFSFLCFLVGWVLLATLEFRRSHPNPWKRPRSYLEFLGILIFNKSFRRGKVKPNENIEEIIKYDEYLSERKRLRKEALENMRVERENNERRLQEEGEELDLNDIDHDPNPVRGGLAQITLAPFKSVLLPVQMLLYKVCVLLRIASSIIMWDDSVAAFWIVTASFLSSLLVAWIPWAFLFRWAFKILVYVVLGPWMKLVDILYVHKLQNMTSDEREAMLEAEYQRRYNLVLGETYLRKLLKEHTMKLKDMQRYMFGQHLIRVPVFKEERYHSIPLAGGSAEPYDKSKSPPINIVKHVDGQYLSGDMIPKRENSRFEEQRRKEKAELESASSNRQYQTMLPHESIPADELTALLEENESNYASI